MLLEAVTIQDMQDKVFLFILLLYLDETQPEMRKRPKKWANLCEAKIWGAIKDFFDLRFATIVKPRDFHGLYTG